MDSRICVFVEVLLAQLSSMMIFHPIAKPFWTACLRYAPSEEKHISWVSGGPASTGGQLCRSCRCDTRSLRFGASKWVSHYWSYHIGDCINMLTQNVEIIDFGKPILFASASLSLQSGRTWIEYIVLHVYTCRDSYRWSNIRTPPLLQQTQTLASIPNITYINHFKKNPGEIAKISYHYIWYYEGSECIKHISKPR